MLFSVIEKKKKTYNEVTPTWALTMSSSFNPVAYTFFMNFSFNLHSIFCLHCA